jgi:hypothetical protein
MTLVITTNQIRPQLIIAGVKEPQISLKSYRESSTKLEKNRGAVFKITIHAAV